MPTHDESGCAACVTCGQPWPATPAPSVGADGLPTDADMPTYGTVPWDHLKAAVSLAQTGGPDVLAWSADYYIGHQPAPMNMNSLNRIVSMFVARALASRPVVDGGATDEQIDSLNGLDTPRRVRFYEHDFYVLSNFSAFRLMWKGVMFDTSEAAYHFEKFPDLPLMQDAIISAPSAHEAFKVAERNKAHRRPDWDAVKVDIMRDILRAKAGQHEYVRRKLLATGNRELVEDSWRDAFWGWGPNRDGQNMLGRLWMEVRAEIRAARTAGTDTAGGG